MGYLETKAVTFYDQSGLDNQLTVCIAANDGMVNYFMRLKVIANLVNFQKSHPVDLDLKFNDKGEYVPPPKLIDVSNMSNADKIDYGFVNDKKNHDYEKELSLNQIIKGYFQLKKGIDPLTMKAIENYNSLRPRVSELEEQLQIAEAKTKELNIKLNTCSCVECDNRNGCPKDVI